MNNNLNKKFPYKSENEYCIYTTLGLRFFEFRNFHINHQNFVILIVQ